MNRFGKLFIGVVLSVGILCVGFAATGTADNNTVFLLGAKDSLSFAAPWDYIRTGYYPELNTSELTVECWVNPVAIDPRNGLPLGRADLVSRQWSFPYALWRWDTGTVNFMVFDDSANPYQITSTSVIPAGVWTHVAGTYSSTTGELKIYVNGVLEGTNSIGAGKNLFGAATELYIGTTIGGVNEFFGLMDEVRISNVSREPGELLTRDGEYAEGYDAGETAGYNTGFAAGEAAHANDYNNGYAAGQADLLDILPPGIRKNVEAQRGFAK